MYSPQTGANEVDLQGMQASTRGMPEFSERHNLGQWGGGGSVSAYPKKFRLQCKGSEGSKIIWKSLC